jgi:hypothetical protein
MKKLSGLTAGCVLLLWFGSLIIARSEKPRFTNEQIAGTVPIGTSPAQVSAFLDSKHIEHSGYETTQDEKRSITAISRGSKWSIVREDHAVTFRFDEADHLISKEPHTWLTGP